MQPEKLVALVRDSGALDRTRNLAIDYARRAKACLNGSGDPSTRAPCSRCPTSSWNAKTRSSAPTRNLSHSTTIASRTVSFAATKSKIPRSKETSFPFLCSANPSR